jgi:hypothetical protein
MKEKSIIFKILDDRKLMRFNSWILINNFKLRDKYFKLWSIIYKYCSF